MTVPKCGHFYLAAKMTREMSEPQDQIWVLEQMCLCCLAISALTSSKSNAFKRGSVHPIRT